MKHLKRVTKSMPLRAEQSTKQNFFAGIVKLITNLVCVVNPGKAKCSA